MNAYGGNSPKEDKESKKHFMQEGLSFNWLSVAYSKINCLIYLCGEVIYCCVWTAFCINENTQRETIVLIVVCTNIITGDSHHSFNEGAWKTDLRSSFDLLWCYVSYLRWMICFAGYKSCMASAHPLMKATLFIGASALQQWSLNSICSVGNFDFCVFHSK